MATKKNHATLIRPMKATWWLSNKKYFAYMLRELSVVFMAAYSIVVSFWLLQLSRGERVFAEFSQLVWSPMSVLFSLIILAFSLYHTLTWFGLTSKVQPVRFAGVVLNKRLVFFGNIVVWLAVSYLIALFLLR